MYRSGPMLQICNISGTIACEGLSLRIKVETVYLAESTFILIFKCASLLKEKMLMLPRCKCIASAFQYYCFMLIESNDCIIT